MLDDILLVVCDSVKSERIRYKTIVLESMIYVSITMGAEGGEVVENAVQLEGPPIDGLI